MIRVYKPKYRPVWKRNLIIFFILFIVWLALLAEAGFLFYLKKIYNLGNNFSIFAAVITCLSIYLSIHGLLYKAKKRFKNDVNAWALYNGRIFFIRYKEISIFLNKKYIPRKNYTLKAIQNIQNIEGMLTGEIPDKRFEIKEITDILKIKRKMFCSRIYLNDNKFIDIDKSVNDYGELMDIMEEIKTIRR